MGDYLGTREDLDAVEKGKEGKRRESFILNGN
jgi:hypothetical protein